MKTSSEVSRDRWPSEEALIQAVAAYLSSNGYCVHLEVPNMGQYVDLVALRARAIMCVEAKIENWRRAAFQCRAHELVADLVCVALGTKRIPTSAIVTFTGLGYGLLHCPPEGSISWVLPPAENMKVWQPQQQQLLRSIGRLNDVT